MFPQIQKSILIQASPAKVWEALTNPEIMKQWMAEPEMQLEVITDWKVGSQFMIRGFHHIQFENKGIVLQFEPYKALKYTYLSSISRLPDIPENHTIVVFTLVPVEGYTNLHITLENFPTESIQKHVNFYWISTIEILKNMIEK